MNRVKNKKSVLFLWIGSYLVLLLILLLISSFVFIFSYHMIERKENDIHNYELSLFQQQMDQFLSELSAISQEIQRNKTITENFVSLTQGNKNNMFHYYDIQKELNRYTIGEVPIYLFFEEQNFMLSGVNGGDCEFIYSADMDMPTIAYEDFIEILRETNISDLVFLKGENKDYAEHLMFVYPISYQSYRYNQTIKMVSIVKNIDIQSAIYYPPLYENFLFLSTGPDNIISLSNNPPPFYDEDFNLKDHVVLEKTSNIYPLKYIMVTQKDMYMRDMNVVRNLTFTAIFMILMLGLILTIAAVRKNYKPVKELMYLVNQGNHWERQGNEYSHIKTIFIHMMEDNQKKTLALSDQEIILRNIFLARLLKGYEYDMNSVESQLQTYGVSFSKNHFIVFLLYVDITDGEEHILYPDKQRFIHKASSALQDIGTIYMFEMDDIITCIVNFDIDDQWQSIFEYE